MRNILTKIILFLLLLILMVACNAIKHVPENEYLLEKNTIIVNDEKKATPELYSYLRQKPNEKVLGIPFSLHLYNLGNPDTLSARWPSNRPGFKRRFSKKFSEKQFKALERSASGFNKWFLKSGNEPVISDTEKIKKSAENLESYYFNNGYWDATVNYQEKKKENKRVAVDYIVSTKNPYFIDTVTAKITSPVLDSLYKKHRSASLIKSGDLFRTENFEKEQERLVDLYRNSGVYHFGKGIMEFDIDTTNMARHKQDVQLKIRDREVEDGDSIYYEPFKVLKVKNVNVFTDFSFNTKDEKQLDSATYNGIRFYALNKLKYNAKYLANSILIEPGAIYKDIDKGLTRKYLRELQNFKPSIDIQYEENSDASLTANIYLSPLKKYSIGWDAEFTTSNINRFGVLGKFSFLNRNVFKGAEILELSFQGSFLNTTLTAKDNNNFFNAYEIGAGVSLKIPRIMFPINTTGLIPKKMAPKTEIGLNIGIQNNIGLDRQNITGSIGYTWQSSEKTNHKFELLNLQYIRNTNKDNYFGVYKSESRKLDSIAFGSDFNNISPIDANGQFIIDENGNPIAELDENGIRRLIAINYLNYVLSSTNNFATTNPDEFQIASNVEEQREILIEDVLVPVISYSYNYNNRESFKDNNFSTFTGRLISSGSLTSAFVKKPSNGERKQLFGLPVAQYLKTEIEYKKYWGINLNTSVVFRQFIGVAMPFGNSDDIPFSRSYRAGGSNDIRAWRTFELGPGSALSTLEFNTGSLKLTTNLEYRFKVFNSLKGALFIDAGNIWDITNSPLSAPGAKFDSFNSIKDIAIGSGVGARYDFGFLIFRLDLGFKTYEPYLSGGSKWFQNYNFRNYQLNFGINYPF